MCLGDSTNVSNVYRYGETGQSIVITYSVIDVFTRHQQTSSAAPEAGGLLFARIYPNVIEIVTATEPTKSDIRSRFLFKSSRQTAKTLIKEKFKDGLHFVGEWHTHPEPEPTPSSIDLKSMAESFARSIHQLDHFIMIIVGNQVGEMKLWVSMHNSKHVLPLTLHYGNNKNPMHTDSHQKINVNRLNSPS